MKKSDFVDKLSKNLKRSKKETNTILDEISSLITNILKGGGEVPLDIGKFQLKQRPARIGINPATRQKIHVQAKVIPAFKPNKKFKDSVLK